MKNALKNLLMMLCIVSILITPAAHAQTGKITLSHHKASKGIQPDGEPTIASFEVYLYRVGTSPNTQPTDLIDCSYVGASGYSVYYDSTGSNCYVQADSSGYFSLTDLYYQDCNADSDIVYFEIKQGTVGGTSNSQLAAMAVPPSAWNCGYLYNNSSSIFLNFSDYTNVMAAFGAGTFANYTNSPYDGISTYAANYTALETAFDAVNNVVPLSTGTYGGSDSNVQKQLNTIADVIATCIDSGGSTGSGTPCGNLYSATTQGAFTSTHAPANTWQAVASMAQDPTANVSTQFNLIGATPPWQPADSSAPSAWTVPVSGAPTISSLSTSSATKSTYIYVYGSGLVDTTTSPATLPTVVVDGQAVSAVDSSSTSSTLYIKLPSHAGNGTLGVYLDGKVSNFVPFTTTN